VVIKGVLKCRVKKQYAIKVSAAYLPNIDKKKGAVIRKKFLLS
jgi:hypothetical protein